MSSSNDHVLVPMSQRNTNGLPGMNASDVATPTGDVLSFHNITYRVKMKSGFLGRKKTEKEILSDIKYVYELCKRPLCLLAVPSQGFCCQQVMSTSCLCTCGYRHILSFLLSKLGPKLLYLLLGI